MAEDICRKSAIIETYVMDSRIGSYHPHGLSQHLAIGSRVLLSLRYLGSS